MRPSKLLWVGMIIIPMFSSCQKELDVLTVPEETHLTQEKKVNILVFQSREQLEHAIKLGKGQDSQGRSLVNSADRVISPSLKALKIDTIGRIPYSTLVPEHSFRELLNERGEIQVGDTIYCISPAGTFYGSAQDVRELRSVVETYKKGDGVPIQENLLKIGNIYLYETFANIALSDNDLEGSPETDKVKDDEARSMEIALAGGIPLPDLNTFPKERGRRITWAGKILQSISFRKSHVSVFPANSRRRVNCAVYDYDYLIHHSIGITAKVQKKMWYGGWAKVKYWPERTILVGYRYALVRYPYPENMYERLKDAFAQMPNGSSDRFFSAQQSQNLSNLPYPSWFKTKIINLTEPLLGLFKVNLTLEDVVSAAGDKIKSLIRSKAGVSWEDYQRDKYDLFGPKITQEELERKIQILKMDEFVPSAVPIYAKDGIYVLYSGGWLTNRLDQSEIDFKLDDGYCGSFMLGYQSNLRDAGFDFSKPHFNLHGGFNFQTFTPTVGSIGGGVGNLNLSIASDEKAGKLIGGDFFAVAYNESWQGYNLTW